MKTIFEKVNENYGNLKSLELYTADKMFVEGHTKQMLKFEFRKYNWMEENLVLCLPIYLEIDATEEFSNVYNSITE